MTCDCCPCENLRSLAQIVGVSLPPSVKNDPLPNAIKPDDPKFYMVYGGGENGAKVKHETHQKAETEAKRLAELNPGRVYAVLAAIGFVYKEPQVVVRKIADTHTRGY